MAAGEEEYPLNIKLIVSKTQKLHLMLKTQISGLDRGEISFFQMRKLYVSS